MQYNIITEVFCGFIEIYVDFGEQKPARERERKAEKNAKLCP